MLESQYILDGEKMQVFGQLRYYALCGYNKFPFPHKLYTNLRTLAD
jgi:hypothetical protein